MKGWLITHKNCLDGATAALVAQQCGLTPVFVEPDQAEQALLAIADSNPIYFADVSLKRSSWRQWQNRITYILDHHQSALPLCGLPGVTIDQSRSGGHLMYDFAVLEMGMKPTASWNRLCLAVERYDLWKPGHGEGEDLNRLFHRLGYEWYARRFGSGFVPFTSAEADLLAQLVREEARLVRTHLANAVPYQKRLSYPLYALQLADEGLLNAISHTLIEQGAGLVLVVKPDGRVSVRTDNRVDAAALMEALFAGGGHARAAGGRLSSSHATDLLDLLQSIESYLLKI
ncbi:MAG: phosphoesterase [Sulfobacillus acidophilus]|uniref:Phosphoesterase n=1 Tax=Sulfobacillus acidophilus TaxID=53633 RepID=A0A2T2WCR4_9FIRM|nr:MAG: phosphoesterase [Sulfobacillus acidophilus]